MSKTQCKTRRVSSFPIPIPLNCAPIIDGTVTGYAKVRNLDQLEALQTRINEKDENGKRKMSNLELVHEMFERIEGLPKYGDESGEALEGEAAFEEVANGEINAYIMPCFTQGYFTSFNIVDAKN